MTAESPKARISDSRAAFFQRVEDNAFHHPFTRAENCLPRYNMVYERILEFF
jgi:hypothetical protein